MVTLKPPMAAPATDGRSCNATVTVSVMKDMPEEDKQMRGVENLAHSSFSQSLLPRLGLHQHTSSSEGRENSGDEKFLFDSARKRPIWWKR